MANADENPSGSPGGAGLTEEDWAALAKFGGSGETAQSSAHPPIPGLEFLGMGYDIFDRYASVDSCKQPILDFSAEREIAQQVIDRSLPTDILEKAFNTVPMELKLTYARPERVTYLPRFEINSVNEFDSTIEDQLTKWTAHTNISGNYALFAGEIDARFSSTLAKLATTKYYSLVSKSTYYELKLDYGIRNPPRVKADVQDDLDDPSVKPEEFFDQYGTHYLSSVAIGCKVTVSCAIETSKLSSDFDFGAYLSATYGGKGAGVSGSADGTYQNKVEKFREHSQTKVFGVGISDEQLEKIGKGAEAGVEVLKGGWHNPSLIDFPAASLKSIWSFCSNAKRKAAFQAEFDKRAKQRTSIIPGLSLYTPMYLYRNGAAKSYRLHPTANLDGSSEAHGMDWKIQNGGRPLFNIAARRIDGTVPLYVYRHKTDPGVYRYEAGALWDQYLNEHFNRCYWSRVSAQPLGFVLETAKLWGHPTPDQACPVYAYTPADDFLVRYYYSLDEDDRTLEPDEGWQRYNYLKDSLRWAAIETQLGHQVKYLTTEAAAREYAANFGAAERPQFYAWLPV